MRVFLIGFMGSGKSYVGQRLAEHLGTNFFDLDQIIEEYAGQDIPSIFQADGEEHFREVERKALHSTSQLAPGIIATGGGTPCFFDNINWMNKRGLTIFLNAPVSVLWERLRKQQAHRPIVRSLNAGELRNKIQLLLHERLPFYQQSHVLYEIKEAQEDVAGQLFRSLGQVVGH